MADLLGVTIGQIMTALGYDGTAFRNLLTDAAGHLQVDALTSGLPAGAATEVTLAAVLADALTHTLGVGGATAAHQVTQNTALQLIDDLRTALNSVATDRLKVCGEDQLISYLAPLQNVRTAVISGANGYVDSGTPGAGVVWCVEHVTSTDVTTLTTVHRYSTNVGGTVLAFGKLVEALALNSSGYFHGRIWLAAGDVIRVNFVGGAAADSCIVGLTGHTMTLEV